MQQTYAAQFERDMGCTVTEWRTWLQAALPHHVCPPDATHTAVSVHESPAPGEPAQQGLLRLHWEELPARRIALLRIPRLRVRFDFDDGLSEAARTRFMRRLDLFLQRGGG